MLTITTRFALLLTITSLIAACSGESTEGAQPGAGAGGTGGASGGSGGKGGGAGTGGSGAMSGSGGGGGIAIDDAPSELADAVCTTHATRKPAPLRNDTSSSRGDGSPGGNDFGPARGALRSSTRSHPRPMTS